MRKYKWLVSPATVMGFLCAATIYGSTAAAAEKNLFNQLVDRSKAEMAKSKGSFLSCSILTLRKSFLSSRLFRRNSLSSRTQLTRA